MNTANANMIAASKWQKRIVAILGIFLATSLLVGVDTALAESILIRLIVVAIFGAFVISFAAIAWHVFSAGREFRGLVYALSHVGLLIVLAPACFVGFFIVPHLINGDIQRSQDT